MARPLRLLILALMGLGARVSPALEWTPIAHSGDPAIGIPGDLAFTGFGVFEKLGANGEVFFAGDTGGPITTPLEPVGLYRAAPGAPIEMIVDYGDAPELEIRHPIGMAIDRAGDWVFATQSDVPAPGCDPGTSEARDERLLRSDGLGGVETVAVMGSQVVNASDDLRYAGFERWTRPTGVFEFKRQQLQMNGSGAIAFGGVVAADPCGDVRDALLVAEPGEHLQLVALQGEPAPGAPDGMGFDSLVLSPAAFDDAGAIVFFATLVSDTEIGSAVYRWDPVGGLALVAATRPPFVPARGQALLPQWAILGPSGAIAYFLGSEVWGPDGAGGVTQRVAPGDPVPGDPEGTVFTASAVVPFAPNRVWVDAAGRIAFASHMLRPGLGDGAGVFRAAVGGPIELLVQTDDVAPFSAGATFGESFTISAVGDDGEIAFLATLHRPGDDPAHPEFAAYLFDASGRLFPILLASEIPALLPGASDEASELASASFGFDPTLSRVAMSPFAVAGPDAVFVAPVPEPPDRATALAGIAALVAIAALEARHGRRRAAA